MAAPKLGSGTRFKKLSATLAARGASDPDALAAYIGRKRYGPAKFGTLSAHAHANSDDLGIYLADGPEPYHRDAGETVQCPSCQKYNAPDARYCDQCGKKLPATAFADLSNTYDLADGTYTCPACGHTGSAGEFGPGSPSGTSDPAKPPALRTPAPSPGYVRSGVPLKVRTGAAHTLANTRDALELTGPGGWSHGWIHDGIGMDAKPEDKADRMSKNISGHAFSDGADGNEARSAHRLAAKAHRQAASLSSSPSAVAHHQKMAKLHSAVASGKAYSYNAAKQMSNGTRSALELAAGTQTSRRPVQGPYDVGVKRGGILYHRRGGNEIGQVKRNDDGTWTAVVAGKPLQAHQHQRAALMEAVGTYNAAVHAGTARKDAPLQPVPQQTELMAEYGIPAMRSAAFATPTAGASDGPRMTTSAAADGDSDSDSDAPAGLSPKAMALYKKLKAKGFPDARALAFAKNSEKFGKRAAA